MCRSLRAKIWNSQLDDRTVAYSSDAAFTEVLCRVACKGHFVLMLSSHALMRDDLASSFISQSENKGKNRPGRNPLGAFMVASLCRLPIVSLLSQACRKRFPLMVRDDRMFYKNCFQQGLVEYLGGLGSCESHFLGMSSMCFPRRIWSNDFINPFLCLLPSVL